MNCHRLGVPILCTGHALRGARCMIGNCRRYHTRACDFPMLGGGTCNAKLCPLHVFPQPDGRDLCPYHQRHRAGEGES